MLGLRLSLFWNAKTLAPSAPVLRANWSRSIRGLPTCPHPFLALGLPALAWLQAFFSSRGAADIRGGHSQCRFPNREHSHTPRLLHSY